MANSVPYANAAAIASVAVPGDIRSKVARNRHNVNTARAMTTDEGATAAPTVPEARRRGAAARAGHGGDAGAARQLLADPSPRVRATALAALARSGDLTADDVAAALADVDASVRRRACALAVAVPEVDLLPLLGDAEPMVVEAAAWALGERGGGGREPTGGPERGAVAALARVAGTHADPLCREAAVAALGAIGDEAGLPAILAATTDKPAVRRRAVLALAPFEGAEVDEALRRALTDRDWQVRQSAEDLLAETG